jgi:GNAT superfamily N-acetyltransferase
MAAAMRQATKATPMAKVTPITTKANPNVSLKILTPPLISKAVDCIGVSFANSKDPFSKALHLNQTHWAVMSQMFVQRAAEKDMSFVAFNEETGDVEGVIINEDWKEKQPDAYRGLLDWSPVRAIFNELRTRFKAVNPQIEHGKVLHPLYFTCVRPDARSQGIVSQLWQKSVELAQMRNYEKMVAEASSPMTQQILTNSRLGFREVAQVPFAEFKFQGKHLFKDITKEGFEKLAIYERPIVSNLFI